MVSGLVSLWLAAAIGQAPTAAVAEAAWLKSVPADVQLVARVRGAQQAKDDLANMLNAMSPGLAAQATAGLQQGLDTFVNKFGKPAASSPFLVMLRLPQQQAMGSPPYAVIVKSNDYKGVLKSLAGDQGSATPKSQNGIDTIKGQDGTPVYAYKGAGFVAFGNDESLTRSIARPSSSLAATIDKNLQSRLFSGDVGIYVNAAALTKQYGEQIDAARQQLIAAMENAPNAGNAASLDVAKSMYNSLFDAVKDAQALALSFDFDKQGLDLGGDLTTKPGSGTSKLFTGPKKSAGESLGKIPADLAYFIYSNGSPESLQKLQNFGIKSLTGPGGTTPPELKKAEDLHKQAGIKEMTLGSGMGQKGIRGVNVCVYSDPRKAVDAMTAMLKAMKTVKSPTAAAIKEVTVEPNAQKYKGFTFSHAKVALDASKLTQPGDPNAAAAASSLKAMFGEGVNTWFGTDGKTFISAVAPDWEKARAEIDTFQSGQGGIGQVASYKRIRSKLPAQVNGLMLVSAQGFIEQMSAILSSSMPNNPGLKPPGDLPREPALFGGSFTSTPGTLQFQMVVPSDVGPVFEKGLVPLFGALSGRVNQ